jgi:hypothetical protein
MENDSYLNDSQTSISTKFLSSNSNDFSAGSHDGENAHFANPEADLLEKGKNKRKPRRIVISLLENMVGRIGRPEKLNGNGDTCGAGLVDEQGEQIVCESDFHVTDKKQLHTNSFTTLDAVNVNGFSDDFIENYFNEKVADSRINESCRNYMRCDCVIEPESMYRER